MNLTGQQIKDTYEGVLNIGATGLTGSLQTITDGLGNPLPMQVSSTTVNFTGTVTGIVGNTGPAGPTGAQGPIGPTGSGGASATGALQTDNAIDGTLQVVKDSLGNSSALRISCVDITNYGGGAVTSNTAFGNDALINNTTGAHNTAIGNCALLNNTNDFNTAIGENALRTNTSGTQNTAVGVQALYNNTGSYNVAMGVDALSSVTSGAFNVGIGLVGTSLQTGNCNILIGRVANAGSAVCDAIAIGTSTCAGSNFGIAIGYNANSSSAEEAIAIGKSACSTSNSGVAIGPRSCATSGGFAFGREQQAIGNSAISIGDSGQSYSYYSISMGYAVNNSSYHGFASGRYIGVGASEGQTSISNNGLTTDGAWSVAISSLNGGGSACLGEGSVLLGGPLSSGFVGTGACSIVAIASKEARFGNSSVGNSFINSAYSCFGDSTSYSTIIGLTGFTATDSNTVYVPNLQVTGQAASLAYSIGTTGTNVSVDWNNSNTQTMELLGSGTISLNNPIDGGVYTLQITQGTGGGHTLIWSNVKWPGGAPPTLSITAGAVDILTFIYGPTAYYGNANLNFS